MQKNVREEKAFYLRNGLKETGLFVNVYDTDFETSRRTRVDFSGNMWIFSRSYVQKNMWKFFGLH